MNQPLVTLGATMLIAASGAKALPVTVFTQPDSGAVVRLEDVRVRRFDGEQGKFGFCGDEVVHVEGQADLHIIKYCVTGHEGTLVEFGQDVGDNRVRVLRKPTVLPQGVAPILEGVDVLPDGNDAEVLVRWRHSGQGGLRTVEKYRYGVTGMQWVTSADFTGHGSMKWVTKRGIVSRPAPRIPGPRSR
jgi:hypothetical protein